MDQEQGSERIIELLNSNLAKIFLTDQGSIAVNEQVLDQVFKGCSKQEVEFGRYQIQKKLIELRRQNTGGYLASLALLYHLSEASQEEEQRAMDLYQEKLKTVPNLRLVSDEITATVHEFFEQQIQNILHLFPEETHHYIELGFRQALNMFLEGEQT